MFTLHSYWRSSCSWRVRLALHIKDVPHEVLPVSLVDAGGHQHMSIFTELNPMAQVPVLTWKNKGKSQILSQSLAIIDYLERRFPTPSLMPEDDVDRAQALAVAEMVNAGIQPLQNLSVLQNLTKQGVDKAEWSRHWIARGLLAIERTVADYPGDFLFGNSPTLAELCLIPQLYNARRFHVALGKVPRLLKAEAACRELPAFLSAHPDAQVDAPTSEEKL